MRKNLYEIGNFTVKTFNNRIYTFETLIADSYDSFVEFVKSYKIYSLYNDFYPSKYCGFEEIAKFDKLIDLAIKTYTDEELINTVTEMDYHMVYYHDNPDWVEYVKDPSNELMLKVLNYDLCSTYEGPCLCERNIYWWYDYINKLASQGIVECFKKCSEYMRHLKNKEDYSIEFYIKCIEINTYVYSHIPVCKKTDELKIHMILNGNWSYSEDFTIDLIKTALDIDFTSVRHISVINLSAEILEYVLSINCESYKYMTVRDNTCFNHCLELCVKGNTFYNHESSMDLISCLFTKELTRCTIHYKNIFKLIDTLGLLMNLDLVVICFNDLESDHLKINMIDIIYRDEYEYFKEILCEIGNSRCDKMGKLLYKWGYLVVDFMVCGLSVEQSNMICRKRPLKR